MTATKKKASFLQLEKEVELKPYVSRGGMKLEFALDSFSIQVKDEVCADVGASTGGFTDCLLKRGAARVYAVDVGYGLLDWGLRNDPRVVVLERTNARHLTWPNFLDRVRAGLAPAPTDRLDLATIDVSFIGLDKVLPPVADLVRPGGRILALVKPQFEAPKGSTQNGVVTDTAVREKEVDKVEGVARGLGLEVLGRSPCPVKGPAGNIEYWLFLGK